MQRAALHHSFSTAGQKAYDFGSDGEMGRLFADGAHAVCGLEFMLRIHAMQARVRRLDVHGTSYIHFEHIARDGKQEIARRAFESAVRYMRNVS